MARYVWGLLSESVITDESSGKVSYINAVERLQPNELPVPLPNIFAAVTWRRESEGDVTSIRMRVMGPDRNQINVSEERELKFDDSVWWRTRFQLFGIEVETAGTHEFIVEQLVGDEWEAEASIPLDILSPPRPEGDSEAEIDQ